MLKFVSGSAEQCFSFKVWQISFLLTPSAHRVTRFQQSLPFSPSLLRKILTLPLRIILPIMDLIQIDIGKNGERWKQGLYSRKGPRFTEDWLKEVGGAKWKKVPLDYGFSECMARELRTEEWVFWRRQEMPSERKEVWGLLRCGAEGCKLDLFIFFRRCKKKIIMTFKCFWIVRLCFLLENLALRLAVLWEAWLLWKLHWEFLSLGCTAEC